MHTETENNDREPSYFHGRNFNGQIILKGNTLRLNITESKKGGIFFTEITNSILEMYFKRFLIFKKVEDLFNELIINQHLQISDENALLLPVEITFRQKNFELKVEIPLEQRNPSNQQSKILAKFHSIQKLNETNTKQHRQSIPQLINFTGDQSNSNYNLFEVNHDMRTIQFKGNNQHTIFNHEKPLSQNGVFQFKVKIIRTANRSIFLGVCGKNVRYAINANAYYSPEFIGLYLEDHQLYGRDKNRQVMLSITVVEGKSILRTVVNMSQRQISWFLNDQLLCTSLFWKEMENIQIYPFVNLYTKGDMIQFIN